ncbi:hypothetical protein BJ944DRAFT_158831 [Cunninghamella echinulata]|nr:hypothetical protein BJ944DRAFT_158831 [Cunninghamella echinulata]
MGIRRIATRTLESLPLKQSLFTTQLPGEKLNNPSDHFSRLARPVYAFYSFVQPEEIPDPSLLSVSPLAASLIDLDVDSFSSKAFLDLFTGQQRQSENMKSWAMNYAGHQFSMFASQLGDGRVVTLFDITNQAGERYEIQLKGSGRTPFSRFGDGYAVLRSSIRNPIERGALVVRLAPSWIRFGSFELFYSRNDMFKVRQLADFCVEHVYTLQDHQPYDITVKELKQVDPSYDTNFIVNKYAEFFIQVAKNTAKMVAQWQNNMSILGLTLDYGPFQFMDYYNPSNICNHSDDAGQYAFKRQPTVCVYNLFKLGVPLFELIGAAEKVDTLIYATKEENETITITDDQTRKKYREIGKTFVTKIVSEEFTDWFMEDLGTIMRKKLGILRQDETIMHDVVIPLLDWATEYEVDYHRFFRSLSRYRITEEGEEKDNHRALYESLSPTSTSSLLLDIITRDSAKLLESKKALEPWLSMYRHCLLKESPMVQNEARKLRMDAVNPRFILRNWIAQDVIQTFHQSLNDDNNDSNNDTEAKKILDACLYACTHPYEDNYDNTIIERWLNSTPEVS